jgi:hypothetical protein
VDAGTSVPALGNAMKATQMKLTQEGLAFCLLHKIAWHQGCGECFGQVDSERHSMGLPRDDAFLADLGHVFKHIMEFDRKRELC